MYACGALVQGLQDYLSSLSSPGDDPIESKVEQFLAAFALWTANRSDVRSEL